VLCFIIQRATTTTTTIEKLREKREKELTVNKNESTDNELRSNRNNPSRRLWVCCSHCV